MGNANQGGGVRPMAMDMRAGAAAPPMPIESGRVTLSLTVSGSVQMRR